jgi:class 3 adenylate cyclase/CHASE2 domain-containing sensor protein
MANVATLEGTGDNSGVWARVRSFLPWQQKVPPSKTSKPDSTDKGGNKSNGRRWKIPTASLICIAILIAGVGIRIFDPPFVESLRVKTFDLYQRLSPRPIGEYPVGIIDIDEKSLADLGQWPWPRTTIAKLLEQAHKMGAAVVGFDVVFAEQDRMSPALLASSLTQLDEATRQHLRTLPSNESFMAAILKRSRVVLGQVGINGDMPSGKKSANTPTAVLSVIDKRSPESRAGGMNTFDWQKHWLLKYKNLLGNVTEIEKAASGNGLFSVWEEHDGVVRRVPLVYNVGKKVYPALSLEMLRVAFGARTIATKLNEAGMSSVVLQGRNKFEVPTDKHGQIWVHFSKPDTSESETNEGRLYISASDIINGTVDPKKIKGKLLIVGTSAVGLKDIRNTPIYSRLPGVEVHANILETIFAAQKAYQAKLAEVKKAVIGNLPPDVKEKAGDAEDAYKKATAVYSPLARQVQSLQKQKKPLPGPLITKFRSAQAQLQKSQKEYQTLAEPISKQMQAAEKAQIAETPFRSFFLRYPNTMNSVEMLLIIFAGIAMMILIPRVGPIFTLVGLVMAGAGLVGITWYLYTEQKILLDVTYPGAVTIAIYAILTFSNYAREAAEKRQVRGAFAHYLSPALVEQLAENPDQLKLGGETKEMTLLFCDVRGFTTISEQFKSNPQGLTLLINRLLTPLTGEILDRQGTIDKYMGDCIMAFWNAPLDDTEHAYNACASSLAMFTALAILNAERKIEAEEAGIEFLSLNVGIGINTGDCVVGNMGAEQRFDYSVLGDAVNLAARLEGQSKNYGVDVVIGEITFNKVGDRFATIELDQIAVKGKTEAVTIFAILGSLERRDETEFQTFATTHQKMLDGYRGQDFDGADALCKELRAMPDAPQVLYDLYEERIKEYKENSPGPDWDGVFIATSK